jgi:hypothetical protein
MRHLKMDHKLCTQLAGVQCLDTLGCSKGTFCGRTTGLFISYSNPCMAMEMLLVFSTVAYCKFLW